MALPEYRGRGSANAGSASSNPGLPAGIEVGDLLIQAASSGGTAGAEATGTIKQETAGNWIELLTVQLSNARLTVFYQIATGTTPARKLIANSGTPGHILSNIAAIKKGTFNASNPFHKNETKTQAKTAAVSYPAIETKIAECLIVNIGVGDVPSAENEAQYGAPTNASLGSLTERFDYGTLEGDDGSLHLVTGTKATTGSVSATTSTGASEAVRALATLAITPLGGEESGKTVEGAAALTGAGTLSAVGLKTRFGVAPLTGAGSLSAAAVATHRGAAALTGTGFLSAAAVRTRFGVAALTGLGSLSAKGTQTFMGRAALSGLGSLIAGAVRTRFGKAELTGTGTLSAAGEAEHKAGTGQPRKPFGRRYPYHNPPQD